MPFASLRRRSTTTERSEPQADEPNKPPVNRGRSITLPSISSRKSFSSLIASSMRGRSTTPSPRKSEAHSLEGGFYPTYDASDHDNDSHRVSRPPSAEKPRRFRRAPSPHPLKGSKTSMSSRLPKKNRNMLNRARSHSSLTDSSPTKSFLHTLADALKTPTALFSNNSRHRSSFDDDDDDDDDDDNDASENSPTRNCDNSPRKSVRFRPGTSIIGLQPKSSPIDIPKATPALPPVRLATTPLQQCLKSDQPDLVPTARPTETPILKSSATFRLAIAATDPADILKDVERNERVGGPVGLDGLPTPFPGTNVPIDNPFEDPIELDDPELIRNMLQEYDGSFTSRTPQSRHHQESFGDYNVPSLGSSDQGASDTASDIKQQCNGRPFCPDLEPIQAKHATLASVTAEESDLHARDGAGLEETPASSSAGISEGATPYHSTQESGKESKRGALARSSIHEEGFGFRGSMSSESVTSTHEAITWTAELALRKHRRKETTELGTTTPGSQDPQKMSQEAFKYRIRLAFVGKEARLGGPTPLRPSISSHGSEHTEESFDDGSMTHELEAVVDDEGYQGSLSAKHDWEPAAGLNQTWVKRWSPLWSSKLGMQMGYGETAKPSEGLKSFRHRLWSPFGPPADIPQASTPRVVDERAPFSYGGNHLWKTPSSLNSSDGDATGSRGQHPSNITTEGRLSSSTGQVRANGSNKTAANLIQSVQLE
ncbi:hypothetical protein ABEF95_016534 [Exophiala dermatitidis]